MPIILQDICKIYNEKTVLDGLNLTLEQGRAYCLMAPSGYGKTTLLRILAGLCEADSGNISGLESLTPSIVFQDDRLCENLSAGANLRMALPKDAGRNALPAMLEELGLGGMLRKPVRELSGGMRRRLALGRALIYGGDIYLLDEPFSGLDHETRDSAAACVLRHTAGKTIIIATHDQTDADALGAEVIMLNHVEKL